MSRNSAAPPRGRAGQRARAYLARLRACLAAVSPLEVAAAAERLWDVARSGGTIFVAGNGGSAATASHLALDLGKSTLGRPPRRGARPIRTATLSDPAVLTAWANDRGYERVFAEQIAAHAGPEDAVLLLSVSGTSPNVVRAARAAREAGALVVALVGRPGGTLRELADVAIVVPSGEYEIVEDVHLAINHIITDHLRAAVGAAPARRGDRPRRS
jgi:D-sedoheptulose 7-phosphate isomerase